MMVPVGTLHDALPVHLQHDLQPPLLLQAWIVGTVGAARAIISLHADELNPAQVIVTVLPSSGWPKNKHCPPRLSVECQVTRAAYTRTRG